MHAAPLAFCVAALTLATPAVADHRPLRPEERRAVEEYAARPDDGCRDSSFATLERTSREVDTTPRWRSRGYAYSIHRGVPAWQARLIRRAHRAWQNTVNDCGLADEDNVRFSYRGRTRRRADRYGAAGDGANVFDVGRDVGLCADDVGLRRVRHIVSCARPVLDERHGIVEVDVRFNPRVYTGFGTSGQPGRSDFLAVAVHEVGHALGLAHPPTSNRWLTMDGGILGFPVPIAARTLGLGDVVGMRALYPGRGSSP